MSKNFIKSVLIGLSTIFISVCSHAETKVQFAWTEV